MGLAEKDRQTQQRYRERTGHMVLFFRTPLSVREYEQPDSTVLCVVEFQRGSEYIYTSNGASERIQPGPEHYRTEFLVYTKNRGEAPYQLLRKLAEYQNARRESFSPWDTMPAPLGEIGLPAMYQGLIFTPPHREPAAFEFFKTGRWYGQILAVYAVTGDELDFAAERGGEELGRRLLACKSPWVDWPRQSVL